MKAEEEMFPQPGGRCDVCVCVCVCVVLGVGVGFEAHRILGKVYERQGPPRPFAAFNLL